MQTIVPASRRLLVIVITHGRTAATNWPNAAGEVGNGPVLAMFAIPRRGGSLFHIHCQRLFSLQPGLYSAGLVEPRHENGQSMANVIPCAHGAQGPNQHFRGGVLKAIKGIQLFEGRAGQVYFPFFCVLVGRRPPPAPAIPRVPANGGRGARGPSHHTGWPDKIHIGGLIVNQKIRAAESRQNRHVFSRTTRSKFRI